MVNCCQYTNILFNHNSVDLFQFHHNNTYSVAAPENQQQVIFGIYKGVPVCAGLTKAASDPTPTPNLLGQLQNAIGNLPQGGKSDIHISSHKSSSFQKTTSSSASNGQSTIGSQEQQPQKQQQQQTEQQSAQSAAENALHALEQQMRDLQTAANLPGAEGTHFNEVTLMLWDIWWCKELVCQFQGITWLGLESHSWIVLSKSS